MQTAAVMQRLPDNRNKIGDQMKEKTMIQRITWVSVLGNVILTVFKLFAGVSGGSGAMISDAVHSLSDVITTLVAYLGVRLSKQPADKEHPYGHERMECVASLILGALLLVTGIGIGRVGLGHILFGHYERIAVPGDIAMIAAIASIVVKEGMYWYTRYYAGELNSPVFMADAWHHRSDALSSIGSLIGITGAKLGFPVMDPAASVIICLFILKVSLDILKDAVRNMTDTSCGSDFEKRIRDFVAAQQGVDRVDLIHSRMFGNKAYVDIELSVDGDKTLREAHAVAERVHLGIEQNFASVKHVMVHVNPMDERA